jgi:hypothetical protein
LSQFIYISLVFIFSGCLSQSDSTLETLHSNDVLAQDIEIPKSIFETIVQNVRSESATTDPVYLFQPLEVIFESEQKSVISKKYSFKFSNGGGAIDLKEIISGQGSFHFYFPEQQFEKMPELEHLYYISEHPKKNIDQEEFGLGCGQWMDLKSKFSDFKKPQKIILNTTAERYLYVAAGYYVFVFRKSNQVYLTHLHLVNSKFSNLKCPQKSKI